MLLGEKIFMEDNKLQPQEPGSKGNPLQPTEAILKIGGAYYRCPTCGQTLKGISSYYIHKAYYHGSSKVIRMGKKKAQRPPLASELIEAIDTGITMVGACKVLGGVSYPYFAKWAKILVPDKFAQLQSDAKYNRKRARWNLNMDKLPSFKLMHRCINGEELAPMHWANFPQKQIMRLVRYGIMVPTCYVCNFSEHRISDYKAPFLLDFVDSNRRNWKLDNVRMLCYNCYFLNVTTIKGMANVDMRILLEKPKPPIKAPIIEEGGENIDDGDYDEGGGG